ncbi:phenylacetate--CoA ligase family protein [Sedimentitalea sp. XS_ASV28]|uniref:phenylacetate--CoA ligase family protein n=1 Tax=Sedimentitalea sp. XS_ASV28 TaxID=3241296 RepID=UPI003510DE9C
MNNSLYHPEKGFTDRAALEAVKLDRLQKQVHRIYGQSEFHRARLDKAGFHPDMIRSLDDLRHIPFMDKKLERKSQEESQARGLTCLGMHTVCDPADVIRISSTSGTTGTPTFTGYTKADSVVTQRIFERALPIMGGQKGDVVMHAFVMSMWIAGLPMADIMQMAGMTVVPIGGTSGPERFAVTAKAVRPKHLNCTPSYAVWMAGKLKSDLNVDPASLGIERIALGGEPGGSIPEIREKISALWGGARIYDAIGASHSSFFSACNCDHNAGLHFLGEDYIHMELIDPASGAPVPLEDGASGEGVYTALIKECAPAIRFRTGDRFVIRRGACACGRDTIRYSIEGRTDDMLLVRGVNVFPAAIKAVVARFAGQGASDNMRIVLSGPPPVQEPPLRVKVELARDLGPDDRLALATEMSDTISTELRFRCRVELVDSGALAAFQQDKNQKQQIFEKAY